MKTATETKPAALPLTPARLDTLKRAFDFADPSCGGKVPGVSWKDPIHISGAADTLDKVFRLEQFTLADLCEAIEHYTATPAVVTRKTDAAGRVLVWIDAAGYRAGPAGDH